MFTTSSAIRRAREFTLDLPAGENIDLQVFLDANVPSPDTAVIVNLQAGSILGSLDPLTYALVTGDLTAYVGTVTLNIFGSSEGAGGLANSGAGGTAISVTDPSGNLTIVNDATGVISGGGGGGGAGGAGGSGTVIGSMSGFTYSEGSPEYWWNGTPGEAHFYDGVRLESSNGAGPYWFNGADVYQIGGAVVAGLSEIAKGTIASGVGGGGGAGGVGAGYTQVETVGAGGAAGSNGGGVGGAGGAGSVIGVAGLVGGGGASGCQVGESGTCAVAPPGGAGGAGGIAGKALSNDGGICTFINNGTVNGISDY